jgi:uncharacterized protein YchJ
MPITQVNPVHFETAGATWVGAASVCPDPSCGCHNLDIAFRHGDRSQVLQVDVGNPMVRSSEKACETAFAQTLSNELDLAQVRLLHEEFCRLKDELYARTDLTQIKYDFPYEAIEDKGLMIAYNEVFPLHQPMIFAAGGPYIATERYCLLPHCDCTKANAVFFRYDTDPGTEATPLFEIDLDVEQGSWAFAEGCSASAPAAGTVSAFLAAFGYAFLAKRRQTLRDLYAWNKELFYLDITPVLAPEKVGRNAPCPCGSGKKYKRCCAGR